MSVSPFHIKQKRFYGSCITFILFALFMLMIYGDVLAGLLFSYNYSSLEVSQATVSQSSNEKPEGNDSILLQTENSNENIANKKSSLRKQEGLFEPATPNSPLLPLPSRADNETCFILRCADRRLPFSQNYSAPGFLHLEMGVPQWFSDKNIHAKWCRVSHLRSLRKLGQKCVIYADDDIYLNLEKLGDAVKNAPKDAIMVAAKEEHGEKDHINSGLLVFSNMQTERVNRLLEGLEERRWLPKRNGLVDQWAFNELLQCDQDNVKCFRKGEHSTLGIWGHCFSVMNKLRENGKQLCMEESLKRVLKWHK